MRAALQNTGNSQLGRGQVFNRASVRRAQADAGFVIVDPMTIPRIEPTSEPRQLRPMDVGRIGESIAARYLVERGCTVLARNWRPKHPLRGELDIIARHGDTIMFVEVKTRTGNTHGDPVEAVNYRKARALRALSAAWLAESGMHAQDIRIDVAAINLTVGSGGSQVRGARVDYLEGVE